MIYTSNVRTTALTLLLLLSALVGFAQSRTIKGRVVDEATQQALPGATVVVVGSTRGATADANGNFELAVPNNNASIKISFLGYKAVTQAVGNQTNLSIALPADDNALEEVVVLAYGEQAKRRDLSGAVSTVKGRDIENIPAPNVEQLIQGRVPGVQVIQNSGAPGGGITVRVRGTTSVSADNQPLYVVDGVPIRNESLTDRPLAAGSTTSPIAELNPNDIESIEVLKDASTAAIYGARAANGVVLITTKRGKAGKPTIDFSVQYGVSVAPKPLPLLDAVQSKSYAAERDFQTGTNNSAGRNDPNSTNRFTYGFYPDGIRSTDWQKVIRQNGPYQSYNMAFRGAAGNTVFYSLSGGYVDEQGTVLNSRYRRGTGNVNLDFLPNTRFKVGTSLNLAGSVNNRTDRGTFFTDPIELSLRKFPDIGIYQVDPTTGETLPQLNGSTVFNRNNPYAVATGLTNLANVFRGYGNVYGEYQIIPNQFTIRARFGGDYTNSGERRFLPKNGFDGSNRNVTQQTIGNFTWFQDIFANYNKTFGRHSVQGLAVWSRQKSSVTTLRVEGAGGVTDADPGRYVGAVSQVFLPAAASIPNGLESVSAKGTYTFDELVSVSGLIKRETSTRFSPATRTGWFPAASGYLRLTRLPALANLQAYVSDLKLRASWGVTGNQNGFPDYQYLSAYSAGYNYRDQPGITVANVPNADLRWETTNTTNIGLDLGILGGRFYLIADYYVKNTKNLILPVTLPTTSGFGNYIGNVGSTQNKGWEIALSGDILRTKDFGFSVNYNVASNQNRLISSFSGDDLIAFTGGGGGFQGIGRVSQPLGTWYGLQTQGVLPRDGDANLTQIGQGSDGKPLYDPIYLHPGAIVATGSDGKPLVLRSGYTGRVFTGGDMLYQDTNHDGVINSQDFVVIGRAQPKIYGGLNNTFRYKSLSLDMFFQYSLGNDIVNGTRQMLESGDYADNALVSMARTWRTQGDITDIPRLGDNTTNGRGSGINAFVNTSRWVEDGSYLRLKTLTLTYGLPQKLNRKLGASNIRAFVSGYNLLTFTRYKGYDPEFNNNTNVLLLGFDYMNYPQPRRVVGGINFTF